MSREIKFRAWDTKQKKMLFDADPFAVYVSGSNQRLLSVPSDNEDCLFEQYTGLKDKNGKEIYEGDIVKCILGNKPIVFHDGRYWIGETLDDLFVANLRYDIEVIGDIHTNPELLGGKE